MIIPINSIKPTYIQYIQLSKQTTYLHLKKFPTSRGIERRAVEHHTYTFDTIL